MKKEVQIAPAWNLALLLPCDEFSKNMACQLMGSVLFLPSSTLSLPAAFFSPPQLDLWAAKVTAKEDLWTAGLEGGRVSLQLGELRYNKKLHPEFSEGFCWN